jgi:hypothetical protein
LDSDIDISTKKVNKINANIIDTKNQIDVNTKTVEVLRQKISQNMDILLEYLTYIYKK